MNPNFNFEKLSLKEEEHLLTKASVPYRDQYLNSSKDDIINKRLNFGKADLILAISDLWIDVQTLLDLDEVAYEFKKKKGRLIRISTKYPALTQTFLYSKGISREFRKVTTRAT